MINRTGRKRTDITIGEVVASVVEMLLTRTRNEQEAYRFAAVIVNDMLARRRAVRLPKRRGSAVSAGQWWSNR